MASLDLRTVPGVLHAIAEVQRFDERFHHKPDHVVDHMTELMVALEDMLADVPSATLAEVALKLEWLHGEDRQGLWSETHTGVLVSALSDLRRIPNPGDLRLDRAAHGG